MKNGKGEKGEKGLREQKKEETREAIHRSALSLIAEKGFLDVTTDEIAEYAGVSPRTFFNYFESKEDAVITIRPEMEGEIRDFILARKKSEKPLETARAVLEYFILGKVSGREKKEMERERAIIHENPELLMRGKSRFMLFEKYVAAGIRVRLGLSESDPYPELLARVSLSVVRLSFSKWAEGIGTPEVNFKKYFDRLEKGL